MSALPPKADAVRGLLLVTTELLPAPAEADAMPGTRLKNHNIGRNT